MNKNMAHGLNPMIKREIDCVHHNSISNVINKSSSLVGNSATIAATATSTATVSAAALPNVTDGSGTTSHSGAGNARTGSRRIFTPQFKLQVLDSYRNDSECKLNQRATARKYNIHRRQIQKWLQGEKTLRQSVANCSQNNMKQHQFHNITHHQMTVSPTSTTSAMTAVAAIGAPAPNAAATTTPAPAIAQTATIVNTHTTSGAYSHHNNNNLHYQHHHHRHSQPYKTALDPARHCVALASSPPNVRLNAAAAVAAVPIKCMNGLPLIQPGAPTNTMGLHPAYSQTPAIKPVPLIQPHHQPHQSPLHQHHHQLHHHQHSQQNQQHENVLMSSACLPEQRAHEILENRLPMNITGSCYENFHRPQAQHPLGYYRAYSGAPIDLSLPRRLMDSVEELHHEGLVYYRTTQEGPKSEVKWYQVPEANNNEQKLEVKVELHSPSSSSVLSGPISSEAVDLTCRKRPNHSPDPSSPPEKIPKTGYESTEREKPSTKPVKLFKPYLPDNGTSEDNKKSPKTEQKDAVIWSIHPVTTSLPSPHYDMHSTHSCSSNTSTTDPNFQPPSAASQLSNDPTYTFPLGSPHSTTSSTGSKFQSSLYDRITPPTSAQQPASPGSSIAGGMASSTTYMWCPKGSPVSGYDTASNYSDSSERNHHPAHYQYQSNTNTDQSSALSSSPTIAAAGTATITPANTAGAATPTAGQIPTGYSLNVKMEPIEEGGSYYHDLTSGSRYPPGPGARHHSEVVQRWLQDHEGSHLEHHHQQQHQISHHRPGIAVYV